jgi:hypothetical protein
VLDVEKWRYCEVISDGDRPVMARDLQEPPVQRYIRRLVNDEFPLTLGAVRAVLVEGPPRDHVGADRCAFLGVITGGARAFRRADGIDVVPLRMLRP